MSEFEKLPPYQRLQNLFSEGEDPILTDKANKNINDLLGIKDTESPKNIWSKIRDFLQKIDGYIFSKNQKISNRYQKRK